MQRIKDYFTFYIETWMQRGAFYQLLAIAVSIVFVAVSGGVCAWALTDSFTDPVEGVWWAFLRLTDPGYLGDDEGAVLRLISTVVTILGYVLFMGSLIAIMTQALNKAMRQLESGLTPIAVRGHVLILGWSNRTPSLVRELVLSEGRVRRFLDLSGIKRLRIVILADDVSSALRQDLQDFLGADWNERQVIFRSGTSLHIEHLQRVNFEKAAVAIIPGADFALGGAKTNDARIIKTLLSICSRSTTGGPKPPPVVAEIFDTGNVGTARAAYDGDINVIAGDAFLGRLIAQTVRHSGLSHVYSELLSHTHGNEVYVRPSPELSGKTFHEASAAFPRAILLGSIQVDDKRTRIFLNPSATHVFESHDRYILLAADYLDTAPTAIKHESAGVASASESTGERIAMAVRPRRRILVLGWNHKIVALVSEFSSYKREHFDIVVLSLVEQSKRTDLLTKATWDKERVSITHLYGDYTYDSVIRGAGPGMFDNIIILGSDWLTSEEESDARTILGYMVLRSILGETQECPNILVELMDPANERLFHGRDGEVVISPMVSSHMMAHTALRPELNAVFGELFGPGGAEIYFLAAGSIGASGNARTLGDIQQLIGRHSGIALGIRLRKQADEHRGGIHLNPDREKRWSLTDNDEIIVLSTYSEKTG